MDGERARYTKPAGEAMKRISHLGLAPNASHFKQGLLGSY